MSKYSLVILAAGLGTRFKDGVKQLCSVGPNGQTIMEYSIKYAKEVGFNDFVIILRQDIEEEFKLTVGQRISPLTNYRICIQNIDDIPDNFSFPNRKKPWGTAHAVYATRNMNLDKFVLINADDYYGLESFKLLFNSLKKAKEDEYLLVVNKLKNSLSKSGKVNRAICDISSDNILLNITETCGIDINSSIDMNACISRNMWGINKSIFNYLEKGFMSFLDNLEVNDDKSEFMLPSEIDKLIKNKNIYVKTIYSSDKGFGLTYKDDIEETKKQLSKFN